MIEAHLKKLRIRDDVSPEEESAIRALVSEVREYRPDKVVIRRGQELNESILLLDGWMARTKDLSDGGRQISELQFSGDFTDIHAFTLKKLDHNIATITPCRVAIVPRERFNAWITARPLLLHTIVAALVKMLRGVYERAGMHVENEFVVFGRELA